MLYSDITGSLNVRYNPDNDYVQILYDSEWHDWRLAVLQNYYLYKNGSQCLEKTGGWNVAPATSYPIVSMDNAYISIDSTGHTNNNDTTDLLTVNKLDFSDFTTLHMDIEISTFASGGRTDTLTVKLSNTVIWTATQTMARTVVDIDISQVFGEHALIGRHILKIVPIVWKSVNSNVAAKIYNIWLSK